MAASFVSEDKISKGLSYGQLFSKLWPYIRKHKYMFLLVVTMVIALAAVSRVMPFIIGYAVDHGFRENNRKVLMQMAFLYLGLELIKMALNFGYNYFFQYLGNRTLFYLRQDLFQRAQNLPVEYYNKTPVGRMVTRMTNDTGNLGEVFSEGVITLFVQVAILISIAISMSLISLRLTFFALLTVPLFSGLSYYVSQRIKAILREQKKKLSELNSFVAENLSGIKVVQLYHQEPRASKKFFEHSEEYRLQNLRSVKGSALMQPILNLLNAFVIGSALYFAGREALLGGLAVGSMVAFFLHAQDIIHPIREILEKYQIFQNALTSGERVFALLEEPQESDQPSLHDLKEPIKQIEFKNLSFRYQESLPMVLKDFNLTLNPSSSVALVGRTGSGKTTVISLLQRFYDPPHHMLFVNGQDIDGFSKASIRRRIGVVQQDPFIFKGSILENITLFDTSIPEAKVKAACDLIKYTLYLGRAGRDLAFIAEEKGTNLSAGEKQVIAFLRVLVTDPDLIILDEATAQIDSATEELIQTATEIIMKQKMCIIIAHRLSTVRKCDQILVMEKGAVIEQGNHASLMNLKGSYYQLAEDGLKSTLIAASAGGIAVP